MKIIFQGLKNIFILSKGQRYSIFILLCLVFITPFLEVFGISMLAPLSALAVGGNLESIKFINRINTFVPLEFTNFNNIAVLILIIILIRINVNILLVYLRSKISVNFRTDWTKTIISSAMYSKYSTLSKERLGSFLETISSETRKASNSLIGFVQLIERSLLSFLLISGLIITSPELTIAIILFLFIVLFILKKSGLFNSYKRGKKLQKYSQLITISSSDILSNIRQIKLFNIYDRSLKVVEDSLNKYSKERIIFEVSNQIPRIFLESSLTIISILVLMYIYNQKDANLIDSIPNITILIVFGGRLANVFSSISKGYIDLNIGLANIESVFKRIFPKDNLEDIHTGKNLVEIKNHIKFKKVSYSWPDSNNKTINDVSITFKKGLNLIKGPSGSGKSTLLNLILGLIKPDSGIILFDNERLDSYNLKTIRSSISIVTQEDELIYGTIAENIRMSSPLISDNDVFEAAKFAKADQFIKQLPKQYETIISEKGSNLSGGQRQRLSLARSIVQPKSVYIFDEVTNSLDKKTETLVQKTINDIALNAIVIQISHLESTSIHADKVFQFDNLGNLKILS